MHFSTLLVASAATLAAASPIIDPAFSVDLTPGAFNITNFVFGCTLSCSWSFNVSVEGDYTNHPNVSTPVYLQGDLDANKDYVRENVSETQQLSAYIEKDTGLLKLEYEVRYPERTSVYRYYGEQVVYAATSVNASLQEPNFKVNETGTIGVA